MRRGQRLILLLYGTAMLILAETLGFGHMHGDTADAVVILSATGIGCVLAAVGLYLANCAEQLPSKRWIIAIVVVLVAQWALLFAVPMQSKDLEEAARALEFFIPLTVVAVMFALARPRHFHASGRQLLGASLVGAMLAGAAMILLTLGLNITESANGGWEVVTGKAQWITHEYDVAKLLPEGRISSWVRELFEVGGYAVYLLALAAGVAAIVFILSRRLSVVSLSRSRFLPWLGGAACFATFFVYNDIYWGWQSVIWESRDTDPVVWYPAAGVALWLVAPVCVLWMIVAAVRKAQSSHALRMLQVAQLPIAGFNFQLMPAYLEHELNIPGLLLLMIGSQLLAWGCIGILLFAENEGASQAVSPEQPTNVAAAR